MIEKSSRKVQLSVIFAGAILVMGVYAYSAGISVPNMLAKTDNQAQQLDLTKIMLPSADAASVDYFLKIEGVDGESTDDRHKGEIEIQSFSWGASNPTTYSSGGAGSGKVHFNDLSIIKRIDKASPQIFAMVATGEHIKEVVLTGQMAGQNPSTFYKVTLQDVMVSSFWQTDGNAGTSTESLRFNFAKIEIEYTPMKADGTAAETVKAGYDLKAGTKI